ncbi:DEAD/DEAH box helicase [Kluyvera georgiana]|uniref:DEAD/DEAH box helicase n=1 Tax=Kluyvera georgiana TaxID=73098 RepID=UPI003F6641A5
MEMIVMPIEAIIIYDEWRENNNFRVELQSYKKNNSIGPFIRNITDSPELEIEIIKEHRKLLFMLRLLSNPLYFPILIQDKMTEYYLSLAKECNVKFYTKKTSTSSIKKSNIISTPVIKSIFNQLLNIKLYFFFFKKNFFIIPFFQDSGIENDLPLHINLFNNETHFKEYFHDDDLIINKAKENLNSMFWEITAEDLLKIQNKAGNKDFEYIFYQQQKKHNTGRTTKNNFNIEWINTTGTAFNLNDKIITAYLHEKNFEELSVIKDIISTDAEKNNHLTNTSILRSLQSQKRDDISITNETEINEKMVCYGFNGSLKDYQSYGILWLLKHYAEYSPGVLLSDDMGLGKTIQSLAFLTCIYSTKNKYLIICPSSLKYNWKSEIQKFFPILSDKVSIDLQTNHKNIHIVSYEQAKKISSVQVYYDVIILDESQKIKNKKTLAWENINNINSGYRILLTGTPIENSEKDLINIISFIYNGTPPEPWAMIENNNTFHSLPHEEKVIIIKNFFQEIILSRKKEDYLTLPKYTREVSSIEMEPKMKEAYTYLSVFFEQTLSLNHGQYNFIILDALLKLRLLCSFPKLLQGVLPDELTNFECNKMKITKSRIIDNIRQNKKTIVFCTFKKILDEFSTFLDVTKIKYVKLNGDINNKERNKLVCEFQNDDSCMIFLSTMHVGGVGLNLTKAKDIIIYNNWWNPAIEAQAIARAHRIGQENEITIFLPVYKDTVEEKMNILLEKKKKLHQAFSNSLNQEDYKFLIKGLK